MWVHFYANLPQQGKFKMSAEINVTVSSHGLLIFDVFFFILSYLNSPPKHVQSHQEKKECIAKYVNVVSGRCGRNF